MLVQELMCRGVRSCNPSQTLADAASAMWRADCGCVPIVDERRRLCGILTDRDICMATMKRGSPPQRIRIEDVMTRKVWSCHPGDALEDAEAAMRYAQVRRLPVTDIYGRLVGLLCLNDMAIEAGRSGATGTPGVTLVEVGLTLGAVSHRRPMDVRTSASGFSG